MQSRARRFLERLLELIYPNRCLLCDEVLPYGSERGCCRGCGDQLDAVALVEAVCEKCGKHHPATSGSLCFDCSRFERVFYQGRGLWIYGGAIKDSIHRFKYLGKPDLAVSYAKEAVRYYRRHAGWQVDAIVPVPLHPDRLKERGFDQCALVADQLGGVLDLPVESGLLERRRDTVPQHSLDDRHRRSNMEGAIGVKAGRRFSCAGGSALVIDDIFTTGATMDACAEALLEAGAARVYFLVLAIGEGF